MAIESPYRDAIGNRLDHPELVPPEYRHLIADDQQRAKRILEFEPRGTVLDIGCSDGAITKRIGLRWQLPAVVGCDIVPRYEWLKIHNEDGLTYACADVLLRATNPNWRFDTIYCCEVLEHLTDADVLTARRNILAVLKDGGDLIVTVPNRWPKDIYEVGCRSRWAWPDHRSAFTSAKLSILFAPYFAFHTHVALYDGEDPGESIWLIARFGGKK